MPTQYLSHAFCVLNISNVPFRVCKRASSIWYCERSARDVSIFFAGLRAREHTAAPLGSLVRLTSHAVAVATGPGSSSNVQSSSGRGLTITGTFAKQRYHIVWDHLLFSKGV